MSLNVSAWSIRNPTPSLVVVAVLVLLGVLAFRSLPVSLLPNIDVPVVAVTVSQSGAAPAELEVQIAKKVEDAVANIAGVKHVTSTIADGVSTTTIEFRIDTDTDRAASDVRDAVAHIRDELPRTADEPIITRVDVVNQSTQTYAASAPGMTLEELSWFVDDVVVRQLQGIRGVGRVDRVGGVRREIHVNLDPDRLMALGVTASDVNRQIRATNLDVAAGRGDFGGREQAIRTLAGARSIEELRGLRIILPGGRDTRLSDLGEVVDAYEEPRSFARLDGSQPVVSFSIYRAKGASDVDMARRVEEKLAELSAARPDVRYTLIDDTVFYIKGVYDSAMETLVEGAVLAVVVVFLFLRDWRATLIAAVAIPLSILPAFWAMSVLGFSFNVVSLLAITLVTGILVDDAIVEIENIVRHMRMGKSAFRGAMEAADEIGLVVVAITLTIVAVFAPVSFMSSIAGQYFKQFGLTVVVAVLFSLLVARFVTPMMAAYLLHPHRAERERHDMGRGPFPLLLRASVRRPFLTLAIGVGLFGLSVWSTSLLPTGFMPVEDDGRSIVALELPPGSTLADMRAVSDGLAASLRGLPEIRSVLVMGGMTPTGQTGEVRKATLIALLMPKAERTRSKKEVEAAMSVRLADMPDLRAWFVNWRGEREFTVMLTGNDTRALAKAAADLETALRQERGFVNVASSADMDRPELWVQPRLDEAAQLGVSPETISETLRVATIGDTSANLGTFNAGGRLVPIRVQLVGTARNDLRFLAMMAIPSASGSTSPLLSVADLRSGQGPSSIDRQDRERRIIIGADLLGSLTLGEALDRLKQLPPAIHLPAGVRLQETGDAELMGDVFDDFANTSGIGMAVVLAILVLVFGNVFQPVTILLSVPLSFGGVVLALLLTGNAISMPVVIGTLMLMGIVTKNAIMIVDFAMEEQKRGAARVDAIIAASRKRARPIVMTTLAMVAGMLPTALGLGDGGEFRAPMAIAVIGGLIVSTVLSLVFVPSFYIVMQRLSGLASCLYGGLLSPGEPHGAVEAGQRRDPAMGLRSGCD